MAGPKFLSVGRMIKSGLSGSSRSSCLEAAGILCVRLCLQRLADVAARIRERNCSKACSICGVAAAGGLQSDGLELVCH